MINQNGASRVSYVYDDFGETEVKGDQDFYNQICYTGGVYDETTGLYYLNARYYDPEDAAFLSQDTCRGETENPQSLNLYAYCNNNPIIYTDPSGHFPWIVGAMWGYRAYKAYKYYKKAKKAYKVVKKARKAKRAVQKAKKVKRHYSKPKSSKKWRKQARKSNKKSRVKPRRQQKKKVSRSKYSPPGKSRTRSKASPPKRKKTGCFVAGTKIATEKGFTAIEKVKAGDRVWAEETRTGKKALKKVKKIFVREKDSIIRLSINGETIETTEEHPFWIKDVGWIPAGSLKEGDLVKLKSGEYVPVECYEIEILEESIPVYNIHVEDYECYYVSEQQVLVHNNNPCGKERIGKSRGKAPRDNRKQNRQIDDIATELKLDKSQRRRLHHEISKRGFSYHEIKEIAKDMFNLD